ncbi:MAG: exodeoxyribonuclease VII large subunit [Pseudomonadota bacterium]|uniref:exodeoxyribonuclease VII large subunit n=1 Tax=unclassified Ectothiorhodospira TaxID=2684909 RepID=UPI001EE87405|nr:MULTISPECIES: exodeoxyribonuclease VII large subunit [unclassified Ectothiorhodospira]MCG5516973.1 exodeoxyribonuclease VII large subunit [Ectothiorhodospira sp. 9100]MCG5517502.1 exodeoxyribonuclease VII large subunit [Ectothiorhodospira sp. 9905]
MPPILTVSALNEAVRAELEGSFPLIWVEGELSNLARPASGHLYFSLKDSGAQVRCALFRNRARLLGFRPTDGTQVLARARVSLYAPRGDYQLIVEHMEASGDGALRRAFEALRRQLEAEGLFDPAARRPLPAFPRRVGVVTSPSGAAIRDILSVLRRRFPALPVLIFPVPVQGTEAAPAMVRALEQAAHQGNCDVLILARGGGSLEDLWAFNEESVARAIRACPVPVVSGVGHETDVTIADFAADLRAATPSAAAELVSPNGQDLIQRVAHQQALLQERMNRRLHALRLQLQTLERHLRQQHPERRLQDRSQRLDELEQRLRQAMVRRQQDQRARLQVLWSRLQRTSPAARVLTGQERCEQFSQRLHRAMDLRLERLNTRLTGNARTLHTVSPLATLGRGYSILADESGQVIRTASQVQPNQRLQARLGEGEIHCRVEKLREPSP